MMPDLVFTVPGWPVLLPLWAVALVLAAAALHHRDRLTPLRMITVVLWCSYLAAVLAVTIFPLQVALGGYANATPWYAKLNPVPVLTIDPGTFVLNVIMTVPLGLLAPLVLRVTSWRQAARAGLVLSLVVETVQFLTDVLLSSGRTADVNDLIANTAGAVIGWHLLQLVRRPRWARRLAERAVLVGEPDPVRR